MTSIQIDRTDGLSSSTAIKGPCRVATTANITLSGEQTIDGVAVVTGDRVLVIGQTNPVDNGIWKVSTGVWTRAKDFANNRDVKQGTLVFVTGGTANSGLWEVTTADPIVTGTTSISFARAFLSEPPAVIRDYLDAAPYVTSRAALKALDTTKDQLAYQIGVGWFEWTLGDFSTHQAADTAEAIYVKANAIANTVGCWVLARAGKYTLIGQGASTYVNYLSYPSAIGGRHYAIAGQISAGTAAAGDKVGVYGAAESGSAGTSDVWGGNFLAQWNTGDPDINVQSIEVDFNNRNTDAAHNPAKLKVGINVTSGGTKIAGYGYYLDASNKPTNAWRQGFVINDGAVLDTGVNVGMGAYSSTFAGRQIVDGGDMLLLQRRTDTTPTGFFARFLNFANTLNLWSIGIDGTTRIGPNPLAGVKLHVSQEDNSATTEFTALGLEGNSAANSTGKIVSANFYGRDTTNARKQTGAIKAEPVDSNWIGADVAIYGRLSDAVVERLRLRSNGEVKLPTISALGTAAAGNVEFDGKAFYANAAASSRQVVTAKQIATVQGSTVALNNASTSAQNIFASANDVLTVQASTTYRFRARLSFNTGATSHTTAFGFGGTATFTSCNYTAQATSSAAATAATPQMTRVAAATATVLTAASTAVTTDMVLEGIIRVNAAGTIIPQITFSAGPTGTCETALDSYFELEPIGSNTVAAVGNWA